MRKKNGKKRVREGIQIHILDVVLYTKQIDFLTYLSGNVVFENGKCAIDSRHVGEGEALFRTLGSNVKNLSEFHPLE